MKAKSSQLTKKEKTQIQRMKKAKKLIAEAVRLLEKCPNSTAINSELFHSASSIDEDIGSILFNFESDEL